MAGAGNGQGSGKRKADAKAPVEGKAPPEGKGQDTRAGLLQAAERILVEEGIQALTVRHIGAVSGLAPTLVTYHFGTVAGLLSELCRINLEPMLAEWDVVASRSFSTARDVLEAWLTPLLMPAACNSNGRALIVLDEIASHGDAELQDRLLSPMLELSQQVQEALRPFLPHLDARELRARVRFLSAAALGPPPRTRMEDTAGTEQRLDGIGYLVDFAVAALEH